MPGVWRLRGTATLTYVHFGTWMALEAGVYRLSAESTDPRVRAVVYPNGSRDVPGLDSVSTPELALPAGSHLAVIVADMDVGDALDADITPILTRIG
ncbi:hypothetical protein [Bifidobacterium catulorum]|uniref:Uncharacterized protein n=1 Tax=Bifidobacterium catulorum TaxID=1630173 RepID=A0A2U2MUE3_9BIFI|nr:hypothetical protein [Bifidobacterium catulorum]PWG60498.1 hypothetical protein DF200_02575 [Bifidobacterium catulorum]